MHTHKWEKLQVPKCAGNFIQLLFCLAAEDSVTASEDGQDRGFAAGPGPTTVMAK